MFRRRGGVPRKFARRANSGPAFKSGKAAGITVCHREYIQDITTGKVLSGSTGFDTQVFPLQVGVPGTFPWLSSLATNFEQYTLKRLRFEFISTCADGTAAGTNNSLGSIMGAVEYNTYGAVPVNKQQLENMYMSRSGKPSQSLVFYVDCKRSHSVLKNLYIRGGAAPPAGQDQRMYDYGYFVLATQGMQAQNVIGELWCTYEVEMMKPQMVGIGSSGSASLTQVGWAYQQPATASARYGGLLWFDDQYITFSQNAAVANKCGYNIRSPPGVGTQVYPNTTIPCSPITTNVRMLIDGGGFPPSIAPPNATTNVVESTYPVAPWVQFAGLTQELSWVDQHGILLESICPKAAPGGLAPPPQSDQGGLCVYFPPALNGSYRLTFNAVLTNSVAANAGLPISMATSVGVRGISMYTTFNAGTDSGTAVGLSNVNAEWFVADCDSNLASNAWYLTLVCAIQLSPSNGAYEWITVSRAGTGNGFSGGSYSQWNFSVESLPDNIAGGVYTLV